jgi:hypothetical protein
MPNDQELVTLTTAGEMQSRKAVKACFSQAKRFISQSNGFFPLVLSNSIHVDLDAVGRFGYCLRDNNDCLTRDKGSEIS